MSSSIRGKVLSGRYRLLEEVGKGGMGSVWIAEDKKLQRRVAVKIMSERIAADDTAQARFEREAMAVARLRSSHIVQVHDYGIDRGKPFMVMELLEGKPLNRRIRAGARLSGEELLSLCDQLAKALQTAHDSGIVHRDLKPANVFIVRDHGDTIAKVIDFGIAKALGRSTRKLTADHDIIGTPQYMSPEQLRGDSHIDPRADLWSFGCILYRATTGAMPFSGDDMMDLIGRILNDPFRPIQDNNLQLPETLDAFFQQALAKEREQRFDSALQMAEAFRDALGEQARPLRISTSESIPPWPDEPDMADATIDESAQTEIAIDEPADTVAATVRISEPDAVAATETMRISEPSGDTIATDRGVATTIADPPTRVMNRSSASPDRPIARYAGILLAVAAIAILLAIRFGPQDTSGTGSGARQSEPLGDSAGSPAPSAAAAATKGGDNAATSAQAPPTSRAAKNAAGTTSADTATANTAPAAPGQTPVRVRPGSANAAPRTSESAQAATGTSAEPPTSAKPQTSASATPSASAKPDAKDGDLFDSPW